MRKEIQQREISNIDNILSQRQERLSELERLTTQKDNTIAQIQLETLRAEHRENYRKKIIVDVGQQIAFINDRIANLGASESRIKQLENKP